MRKLGKFEEGIKHLDNIISTNPTNLCYYYIVRGDLYRDKGEYEKAINDYKKGLNEFNDVDNSTKPGDIC